MLAARTPGTSSQVAPGLDAEATGVVLGEGEAVSVLFDDDRFGGFNVCNSFGGEHTIDGDEITITEAMSTLVGCANSELSDDVDAVFRGTATFEVTGARLIIRGESGEATLTFVEIPPADDVGQEAIEGTWEVHPVDGGPAAATTVTFAADGSYDVVVGCGRYGGQWEVDRGRIAFPGGGTATSEGCPPTDDREPSADEVLVTAALAGAHLRPVDAGLEVLDRTGVAVAVLRPSAG